MAGILCLVPTPIGNLGDISLRARQTLENADFIAAEDTRVSLKLLNHLEIKKPLVSYYEHNKTFKGGRIVERILAGETCALVSDAGSPAISDPGEDLVKECAAAGITVCAIPGPCAAITALSISGQSDPSIEAGDVAMVTDRKNQTYNTVITNNTFVNCGRGLGSHSGLKGAEKNPYTYITVKNNVIRNCIGEGIYGQNWKNTTISGNTIQKCRQSGIHLQDASNVWVTKNKITDVKRYTGSRKSVYDPEGKYGVGIRVLLCKKITADNNQITKVYTKGILLEKSKSGIICKKNRIKGLKK